MKDRPSNTIVSPDGHLPPLAVSVSEGVWQIPLPLSMPGFNEFISAWLVTNAGTVLVDPGPSATVARLLQALESLGIDRLDAILLTHIHLDHAGGVGEVAAAFPQAPVVCHASAIKHLADPARLWAGSLKTLGDTARAYGPLTPVATDRLVDAEAFEFSGVTAIATPGHAVHHVSFCLGPVLMAGEVSGVYQRLDDDSYYLRPATPPRFFLETSLASLEALAGYGDGLTCFGHNGWTLNGRLVMAAHGKQLRRWADIIGGLMSRSGQEGVVENCLAALLAKDPCLASFDRLPPDVQQRERFFLKNSIRGFVGYLESRIGAS